MDFKSILNKLDSFSAPPKGVDAPKLADPIRLDEGTELRVLAGVTQLTESVIAEKKLTKAEKDKKEEVVKSMKKDKGGFEKRYGKKGEEVMHATATKIAKKKAESVDLDDEAIAEEMKVGDKKKSASGGTITKTATGIKHERDPESYDDGGDSEDKSGKGKKSHAKSMSAAEKKDRAPKQKQSPKSAKTWGMKDGEKFDNRKKDESVKEAAKPDFLDMDKDGDKKEPMKKAVADKGGDKKDGKKGMSDKQAKYFGKKNESLSFSTALKVVKESRGQFQIDPMDKNLWAWAERVGKSKFNESVQAQAFAAATYERMGGEWGLHKVITETQKKNLSESQILDEGIMDKIKSFAVPKLMKLLGPDAADIANAVKQATGGDFTANKENAIKVVKALGINTDAAKDKSPEMAEGIAGNWQGKLQQALYTLGLLGSAGAAAAMWGTVGGSSMAVIGTILLMFANAFFGEAPGQVGAMGKFGNKGTSARTGKDDFGRLTTNSNVR
jgi:hypothetical protein